MICPWCDKKISDKSEFCPECGVELNLIEAEQEDIEKMNCLRCKGKMDSLGVEKIQLGQTGFILGDLPNLFAGALQVEIFKCNQCGKIEFFWFDEE